MQENSLASYLFHQGTNYHAYEYMGVHRENGRVVFRVWAPNADSVSLVGDFNNWDESLCPFEKITDMGVWEASVDEKDVFHDCKYKFAVKKGNVTHYKSDPYAFFAETLSHTASIIPDKSEFEWGDGKWLEHRKSFLADGKKGIFSAPVNIYEMHLGSWRTRDGKSNVGGDAYLNYREIAHLLTPYLKKMGYTHVEFMPVFEHPYDGSWGYQVCSYFAPTSRFGNPDDFKYLIDTLHREGIGVILDWVPAHFPKDEHGLYEFDGVPLYEYQDPNKMEHKSWGTRCFDVGRNEVQSFLISSAVFWLKEYHIDGLRTDAVASMLYLDYDRKPGEWTPNTYGGNYNLEAIAFFKKLNTVVFSEFPDVMMIAEESTAYPMVTAPVCDGGLGFNFKWNMGWANDMFDYLATDPYFRSGNHSKLTFPLVYAYSENFILPISHDEVVHGKKSLIDKMNVPYEQKFPSMRAFLTYMMTTPGKKMLFMGCEYGQFREWDYENQLEWFMTDFENHDLLQYFTAELNHFYIDNKQLWEIDFSWEGFSWINADDKDANVISYKRKSLDGSELVIVVNFANCEHPKYPIKCDCDLKTVFSTEEARFGGTEQRRQTYKCKDNQIKLNLKPLSAVILKPIPRKEKQCTRKKNV